MVSAPSTAARRQSPGAPVSTSSGSAVDLIEARLLVPASVFPKEKVVPGFRGWDARVTGVDGTAHRDGPHVFVRFHGWSEQYHFPASLVRTWVVGGAPKKRAQQQDLHEEEGGDAAPPPHKTPRKAPASSSRTAAASSRHGTAAPARAVATGEPSQPAGTNEEDGSEAEEPGPAHAGVAMPAARSAVKRHSARNGAAAGMHDAADAAAAEPAGKEREQQGLSAERGSDERSEEEGEGGEQAAHLPLSLRGAVEAWKEGALTTAAAATCYGLLRLLYPDVT